MASTCIVGLSIICSAAIQYFNHPISISGPSLGVIYRRRSLCDIYGARVDGLSMKQCFTASYTASERDGVRRWPGSDSNVRRISSSGLCEALLPISLGMHEIIR